MNADKMYIPSMEKWSKYYQNVVQGNNKTYITHIKNTGRNGSFMIPIENQKSPSTSSKSNEKYNIHLVSPSAQMVEMAKESLEDEGLHIKGKKRKRKTSQKATSSGVGVCKKKREPKRDVFSEYMN